MQLGLHSRRLTRALVQDGASSCDFSASGKLLVYQDAAAFAGARAQMRYQASLGCEQHALGRDECLALEPALADIGQRVVGGVYTPSEDAADCQALCASLARGLGARLRLGTRVRRPPARRRGPGAGNQRGRDAGRRLCRGQWRGRAGAVPPGRPAAADLPAQGYSLTYALGPDSRAPRTSLSDMHNKVVYARLGDRLRVAGMVDIGDRDAGIDGGRIHQLKEQVRRYLPRLAAPEAWAGLRPARPDGKPLIGRTPVRGLWINAGHGALGFTLAAGSAGVLADRIAGRPSPISDTLFQW